MLFARQLSRIIRFGDLTTIDHRGKPWRFGGRPLDGVRPVAIRLHTAGLALKLAARPALAAGEAYMDGTLTVEDGSLADFLAIAAYSMQRPEHPPGMAWHLATRLGRLIQQHNPVERSRRNVAHHYDLSERLYRLFLDEDMQYSCAYLQHPGMSLEEAQEAKKRHIAAKLLLKPGQKILDIGCGWGGMALSLARAAEVEVTGITLSVQQLEVARRRAAEAGLADRVRFELLDYRHATGPFDRIVSVGMFEHVGIRHYDEFFGRLRRLLTPDGVAVLHSIGRSDGPGVTNPWLRKYIFPGGYSPALSEVLPAVEDAGLSVTDVEVLRLHYAWTLAEWHRRFQANRAEIARLYDERFCRMWEFYLVGSEMAFRHQGHMVFQMQLAANPAVVPETRDYITAGDRPPLRSPRSCQAAE